MEKEKNIIVSLSLSLFYENIQKSWKGRETLFLFQKFSTNLLWGPAIISRWLHIRL